MDKMGKIDYWSKYKENEIVYNHIEYESNECYQCQKQARAKFENNPNIKPIYCKDCKKANADIGFFHGEHNLLSESEKKQFVVPLDHINKKHLQISHASQKDFDTIMQEASEELISVNLFKCPRIEDYSALERFGKLQYVRGYWNHSCKKLWDASKTPHMIEIDLNDYTKIDSDTFAGFSNLKNLSFAGEGITIKSFDFLYGLGGLEQLYIYAKVLSCDVRPILSLKACKNFFIGDKYHKLLAKYLKDGTIPAPSDYSDLPTKIWLENDSTSMTKKQIKQLEKALLEYSKRISTAKILSEAKSIAKDCVLGLNLFAEHIETSEREVLFNYLIGKAPKEWYDELSGVIDEFRDW